MIAFNPYQSPKHELLNDGEQVGQIRFFSPTSRIGRLRYLAHMGVVGLAACVLLAVAAVSFAVWAPPINWLEWMVLLWSFAFAFQIPFMVLVWIIMIQRLHDLDKSGWWSLLVIIPFVNAFVMLALMFWPGTPGENRFGKKPPQNKPWHWVVGLLFPAVLLYGVVFTPAYQHYVERVHLTH